MKFIPNAKSVFLFVMGGLAFALLQGTTLKAATGQPTGSCVLLGNYSAWAWSSTAGKTKEYSELGIINFDLGTYSTIINKATAVSDGDPNYTEGSVSNGSFTIQPGPMAGTYKLMISSPNDYAIIAPANGGNTIFFLDSAVGMSGVCQKV